MPRTITVPWTEGEDAALCKYMQDADFVQRFGTNSWTILSTMPGLQGRIPGQIRARWRSKLQPGLVKGPFTKEEDAAIREHVKDKGERQWTEIGKQLKRDDDSVRKRWIKILQPAVAKGPSTKEEDAVASERAKTQQAPSPEVPTTTWPFSSCPGIVYIYVRVQTDG